MVPKGVGTLGTDLHLRYTVNRPNVIHETIDGEAIIINLMSGRYYSLQDVAVHIWNLVEQRLAVAEITQWMADSYKATDVDMHRVVVEFLDQLKEEDLIRATVGPESESNDSADAPVALDSQAGIPSFGVPVLHTFTDMEDLLLLDPIHEVDESGWPAIKRDARLEE